MLVMENMYKLGTHWLIIKQSQAAAQGWSDSPYEYLQKRPNLSTSTSTNPVEATHSRKRGLDSEETHSKKQKKDNPTESPSNHSPCNNCDATGEGKTQSHTRDAEVNLSTYEIAAIAYNAACRRSAPGYKYEDENRKDFELIVRNEIQRCEGFLMTLQTCLELYKKNGQPDLVVLMARNLEKVVDIQIEEGYRA